MAAYRTRVVPEIRLPLEPPFRTLDGPRDLPEFLVLIGVFDLRGLGEGELWRRLMASEFGDSAPVFTALIASIAIGEAESAVPKSRHASTLLIDDPDGKWQSIAEPDRPERSFAAVVRGGLARPLMVGAPTEDAWDTFSRSYESSR